MIQFDEHIFQMGWELNHQQQLRCRNTSKLLSIVIMALKPGRLADQGVEQGSFLQQWDCSLGVLLFCWLDVGRTNMKRSEKRVVFCVMVVVCLFVFDVPVTYR